MWRYGMNTIQLTRQLDIIPLACLNERITVVGAGAVGSAAVLQLCKMGFNNITVYDFDKVSAENMNCQMYPIKSIGINKVAALFNQCDEYADVRIKSVAHKFEPHFVTPGILISAVDSMATRAHIFEAAKLGSDWLIDPRMGAEDALLYTVDMTHSESLIGYVKSLYSDEDAVQERCTAKATIYTASMLGGLVAKTVKDIVTKGAYAKHIAWDIKHNDFIAFNRGVNNGGTEPQSNNVTN
jgi:hypothetical protein